MGKQICPFCSTELEEDMYNGMYGCDTGCEYVTIEIECPACKKVIWSSGEFGSFGNDKEKEKYHEEFMQDFAKEIERIKNVAQSK